MRGADGNVYVYHLPSGTACVLGYVQPTYRLAYNAAVTAGATSVAWSGVPAGSALAVELYTQRFSATDCGGYLTTASCTV